MKRFAFVCYRKWAYDIFKNVEFFSLEHPIFQMPVLITTKEAEFEVKEYEGKSKVYVVDGKDNDTISVILKENKIDAVFYYGWSWFVKEPILSDYTCLCLHPSPLPKYRGGSPIQHQIINGEDISAVSVFKITEGVDDGDIYKQKQISLSGSLQDIFSRIVKEGTSITEEFIVDSVDGKVVFTPQQNLQDNPPLKRRTNQDGEILPEQIANTTVRKLYDTIRALADPYPNAYIKFSDSTLYLQEASIVKEVEVEEICINSATEEEIHYAKKLFIKAKDGNLLVTKFKILAHNEV
jgi:methionyl-tRNA formyltransferase